MLIRAALKAPTGRWSTSWNSTTSLKASRSFWKRSGGGSMSWRSNWTGSAKRTRTCAWTAKPPRPLRNPLCLPLRRRRLRPRSLWPPPRTTTTTAKPRPSRRPPSRSTTATTTAPTTAPTTPPYPRRSLHRRPPTLPGGTAACGECHPPAREPTPTSWRRRRSGWSACTKATPPTTTTRTPSTSTRRLSLLAPPPPHAVPPPSPVLPPLSTPPVSLLTATPPTISTAAPRASACPSLPAPCPPPSTRSRQERRTMMTSPISSVAPPPSAVAPPLGNRGQPRALEAARLNR
ncbi:uncharacterized protein [Nerophis lumbriciformis]|uniref:uncharacterized protein isoform X1 n=1 Tax=Nerophis lumbriciformis TaxID=546530 RepID=UPI003BACC58E